MRQFLEFLCILNKKSYFLVSVHHNNYNIRLNYQYSGFQVGPTFPIFPTFPYFFDLLLLFPTFLENALLSLLFHSKMIFTRKYSEMFPCSLGFYKLTSMFIGGVRRLTTQFLNI